MKKEKPRIGFGYGNEKNVGFTNNLGREEFETYVDTYVRVNSNSGSFLGKMASTNHTYTILNPSLISESINIGEHEPNHYITDKDITITTNTISSIEPVREEYLENIVTRSNKELKAIKKGNKKKK